MRWNADLVGHLSSEVLHNQPGPRTQVLLFGSTGACIAHDASERLDFMQPCEGQFWKWTVLITIEYRYIMHSNSNLWTMCTCFVSALQGSGRPWVLPCENRPGITWVWVSSWDPRDLLRSHQGWSFLFFDTYPSSSSSSSFLAVHNIRKGCGKSAVSRLETARKLESIFGSASVVSLPERGLTCNAHAKLLDPFNNISSEHGQI